MVGHVPTWMISGLFVGWLVRAAMGSRREFGVAGDLTLGLLGGLTGGWLFKYLGVTAPGGSLAHVFVATIGAVTLVGGARLLWRAGCAASGVRVLPGMTAQGPDLESEMSLLNDFERRVLARVLGRKSSVGDPNLIFDAQLTLGERLADRVATFGGSWTFIVMFLTGLVIWMIVNEELARPFDSYPFILLNLVLSCVAALQAPVIMMSQNRQAVKDRLDARSDYEVNLRAEIQIMGLHAKLDAVREREWTDVLQMQREQLEVLRRIDARLGAARVAPDE